MRKNRTLPYGYQIINGAMAVNEPEAEVVRRVFRDYAAGRSYKAIAAALTQSGSRYTPGKPEWNKNIIARMLQNQAYLGTELYPPILAEMEYSMAQNARKPYTLRQAPELKAVCGMLTCGACGAPVRRRNKSDGTERWYCESDYRHIPSTLTDAELLEKLQNLIIHLTDTTEGITGETRSSEYNEIAIARLENEINAMLDRNAESSEELLGMILRLAADKYAAISGADAECVKIHHALRDRPMSVSRLPEIADSIAISGRTVISIALKNGQTISEGDTNL
jgi:hypothetical protein